MSADVGGIVTCCVALEATKVSLAFRFRYQAFSKHTITRTATQSPKRQFLVPHRAMYHTSESQSRAIPIRRRRILFLRLRVLGRNYQLRDTHQNKNTRMRNKDGPYLPLLNANARIVICKCKRIDECQRSNTNIYITYIYTTAKKENTPRCTSKRE